MEDTEAKITPGLSGVSILELVSALLLGGVVLVIGCIVRRLSRSGKSTDSTKNTTESEKVKFEDTTDSTSGSTVTGATGGGAGSNKRAKNKKRREAQQEFTHSWMVGALKGHTARVLDMNFSSNGKFLASCAEDCGLRPEEEILDPGETDRYTGCKVNRETPGSTKAAGGKSKSSPSSAPASPTSAPGASSASATTVAAPSTKEDRAILSRRQRKNRTRAPRDQHRELRDDEHEPEPEDEQADQQQEGHRHHHLSRPPHYPNGEAGGTDSNGDVASAASRNGGPRRNLSQNDSHREEKEGDGAAGNLANNDWRESHGIVLSSQRTELHHLSDAALASILRRYILTGEQLAQFGYPVECSYYPGHAVILSHQQHPVGHRVPRRYHHLDVNAREFVPGSGSGSWTIVESEADSGNCSGSSVESSDLEQESASDSDKSSDIGESSSSSSSSSSSALGYQEKPRRDYTRASYELVVAERRCVRCFNNFYVNQEDDEYLHEERCVYHWGKLRNNHGNGSHGDSWECCRGREAARGCTTARMHVWTGLAPGYNGPFEGYARTRPAAGVPMDGNYGVYALDCEMCFTRRGLEVAKVTVVDVNGMVVYDIFVKPDAEVIDYNTRFSGITATDLSGASKSLREVQEDLISFVHAETILIGHGLENDLRALRLFHTTVIDTCVTFPHFLGYPFRISLKTLARTVLRREIQVTQHDSVEDARIVMDLILRKLKRDFF